MSDLDRPLNERGLLDAPMMARRFADRNEPVDLLISSPAKRAITTAHAFASALGGVPVQEDHALYLADAFTLISIIKALPDHAGSAMLFGHNPGLGELAAQLAATRVSDLPTCAIVRIDLPARKWKMAAANSGALAWWDTPKRG